MPIAEKESQSNLWRSQQEGNAKAYLTVESVLFPTVIETVYPEGNGLDLPMYWGFKTLANGKKFFFNVSTDETCWTLDVGSNQPVDTPESFWNADTLYSAMVMPEWTWEGIRSHITRQASVFKECIHRAPKSMYTPAASLMIDACRIMFYASGISHEHCSLLRKHKLLKSYRAKILSLLSNLVTASTTASTLWTPPDSKHRLYDLVNEIVAAVQIFVSFAQKEQISVTAISDSDCLAFIELSKRECARLLEHSSTAFVCRLKESLIGIQRLLVELQDPQYLLKLASQDTISEAIDATTLSLTDHMGLLDDEFRHFESLLEEFAFLADSNDDAEDGCYSKKAEVKNAFQVLMLMSSQFDGGSTYSNDSISDIIECVGQIEATLQELLICVKIAVEKLEERHNVSFRLSAELSRVVSVVERRAFADSSDSVDEASIETSQLDKATIQVRPESPGAEGSVLLTDNSLTLVHSVDNSPRRSITGSHSSIAIPQTPVDTASTKSSEWYSHYGISELDIAFNSDGSLRGGTLEALVIHLTAHDIVNPRLVTQFLLTFDCFTTPAQLLGQLKQRFLIEPPESLATEELKAWTIEIQTPVRLRTLNVLNTWVEAHIEENEEDILDSIEAFAVAEMKSVMPSASSKLLKTIERRRVTGKESIGIKPSLGPVPPRPMPPTNQKSFTLMDIHPLEIARQLSLMEREVFRKIEIRELKKKAWSREDSESTAPNVRQMIAMSNQISNWVGKTILSETSTRKRAKVLTHIIHVAERLFEMKNYNTLMAIIGSLDSSHIHRLRHTWKMLSLQNIHKFKTVRSVMLPSKNFSQYRAALKNSTPPCLPFLGLYLTDLTFLEDGSRDSMQSLSHIINFNKMSKVGDILSEIRQYQHIKYRFVDVPVVQRYLSASFDQPIDEASLYQMSLTVEPKEEARISLF